MSQSTLESVGAEVESKIAAAENEVAAAKAEVAGAKAQLAEAKERLVKAEDVLGKAGEAAPVDAQRVAEAKLGVAKAELGIAKAELGVTEAKLGVAEAKWQAAPEDKRAVYQTILKTAQESVKTAQESVKTAQKIVETANMAYEKALGVPTATPQHAGAAGGDQAASGQGGAVVSHAAVDFTASLREIRDRLGAIEAGQTTLEQKLDSFSPVDPWEFLSSKSSQSQQSTWRPNLQALYHPGGANIMCIVSQVVDDPDGERVIAAHLWPRSRASAFNQWSSRRKTTTSCQDINGTENGLFLLRDIEQAFDAQRVCFICDPFKMELQFWVLDRELHKVGLCPKGCDTTWSNLHKKLIKSPEIEMNKRPSFQILSHHAQLSVNAASQKGWLNDEEKMTLQTSIEVSSPAESAA